jgi:hypothetical protein
MNDKDIENINTVDIKITAESVDAHVMCLKENGYRVLKKSSIYTNYIMYFLLGGFIIGSMLA